MFEIIHVSDLHFGRTKRQTRRARNLLRKIQERFEFGMEHQRYLLVTGDITNDGETGQYHSAE